ncbi:MAG: hypothetical protein JWM31_3633, partial [Solirubrobacterales bacterium]|nr:hypothetical protein [Solirubrobacterales bacterium]
TARKTAPGVTALLKQAQPFADQAAPVFAKLAPQLACVRPYAPEIAALMTQWSSFTQPYDNTGHIGRLWGNAGASSLTSNPLTAAEFTKVTGQGYAFPRPPGLDAGKPTFDAECGITKDALDPTKDPEKVR